MKNLFRACLSVLVLCGLVSSAPGLTIIPTFDASITNNVNGPAMVAAINHAIQVEESNLVNNVTVKIHFTNDVSVSLGQSDTAGDDFSYPVFLLALKASATSANDANGYGKLPNSVTDPVAGGSLIYLNLAAARLLGLTTFYGSDGLDSTISLNMTQMNFTRPPADPNKYDLAEVAEHEINEVLGISSDLPYLSEISPIDLFRYTTNRVRTYTTDGDNAYFSVDGTNLLARYNMDPSGDYGDWWSVVFNWLAGQIGNFPQVQDAFGEPGYALDNGSNEWASLDVVGWTLASTVAPAVVPSLKIARSGINSYTLSWTNTAAGYSLQENTNLLNGATWVASATGSTNPATIVSLSRQKFYRLYKPGTPAVSLAKTAPSNLANSNGRLNVHRFQPMKP